MKDAILKAMKADCVPEGSAGRWYVKKRDIDAFISLVHLHGGRYVKPGNYTFLHCYTDATLMRGGECVMNDFDCELKTHLDFSLKAKGKILVGGLGLGCVVRGLLANHAIESIDLIERDDDVIKLCWQSVDHPKVKLHHKDALTDKVTGGPWDWIWWDLWNDPCKNEPSLALIHMRLIKRYMKRTTHQGAWALPRRYRRALRECGVI